MKIFKSLAIWLLAFILTVSSAVYQRLTGPTHPARGKVEIGAESVSFKLPRSYNTGEDCPVSVKVPNSHTTGTIVWKRYKTGDEPQGIPMLRDGEFLNGKLPMQPAAGKLEYQVLLRNGSEEKHLPEESPAVIRYKGAVPGSVLIPHIFIMFGAMLFSMRVLLGVIFKEKIKSLSWTTLVLLVFGGLILGPIVQKYAFGAFWTGWPFGEDLTDNKTLAAFIAWVLALWFLRGSEGEKRGRWWAFAASIVLFAVYMIPHSMRGSELDYSQIPQETEVGIMASSPEMDSTEIDTIKDIE
ncbi:hypothetical protein ACFLQJ_02335 [Calditrichota bacterium]